MEFIVSEKKVSGRLMLIISDKDIICRIFTEGRKQLDMAKEFYQGEERKEEHLAKKLKEAYIAHCTGKNSVALGVKLGLINEDKILIVDKVPHAEVVMEG